MAWKRTGYLASATAISWDPADQSLDGLVDNEFTDLSNEIDNSIEKHPLIDIRLPMGSAAFNGSDSRMELYIIRSVDGANYPAWVGNVTSDEPQNMDFYEDCASTSGDTSAQELHFYDVPVPPGKYKIGFRNRSNVTTAISGNAPEWRPHSYEDS